MTARVIMMEETKVGLVGFAGAISCRGNSKSMPAMGWGGAAYQFAISCLQTTTRPEPRMIWV